MRADVPVGAYVSGGLDSSITATLAASASPHQLRTFSISFADPDFDESVYQREVADMIKSRHSVAMIGSRDIAETFPDVLWHTETPIVRSAPVPMYHLAKLTRERGIKVVLTGEGADELFLGYDLFKEVSVRRFCARRPESQGRPRLFDRLYPYLTQSLRGNDFWRRSFLEGSAPGDPLFSHMPRFLLGSWAREFYTREFTDSLGKIDVVAELRASLPTRFFAWSYLNQAAYLEMTTLLSPYLLSSQGDRMAMAHGVEGRFPFLDHHLYEFAASLPTGSRLRGLKEKEILRRWANRVLPPALKSRGKQPYRAPDAPSFFAPDAPKWVEDHLTPESVRRSGIFDARAVGGLVRRCRSGLATGFRENQAILGILSTQLWHHQFLQQLRSIQPLSVNRATTIIGDLTPVTYQIQS
jgi:asparagine synthase (glutamine-hydrolysing)